MGHRCARDGQHEQEPAADHGRDQEQELEDRAGVDPAGVQLPPQPQAEQELAEAEAVVVAPVAPVVVAEHLAASC